MVRHLLGRLAPLAYVALAAVGSAGCGKQQPQGNVPTCAQIIEHVYSATKIAYPGHGEMDMGNRKADIAACEQRDMSVAERRCIMAAKDPGAIAECRRKHTAPPK